MVPAPDVNTRKVTRNVTAIPFTNKAIEEVVRCRLEAAGMKCEVMFKTFADTLASVNLTGRQAESKEASNTLIMMFSDILAAVIEMLLIVSSTVKETCAAIEGTDVVLGCGFDIIGKVVGFDEGVKEVGI